MNRTRKKKRSRALYHLTVAGVMAAICLIIWLIPGRIRAFGADDENETLTKSAEGTVVTFTNTKNHSPDLYVTKTIQTFSGDITDYSDVEFTFILWLNGSVARQTEYTVWDANGNQLFLYEDGESAEKKSGSIAYLTSRYGKFTLKAGQMAKFSNVGAGIAYEVQEEEQDGFTQIVPSGGANASGTIASDGAVAAFTNLVIRNSNSEESGIKIYKTASFPDGWTQPESPAFSFTITVNQEQLIFEDYEVYDTETDTYKETRTTDTEGNFYLYAGEYALFQTKASVDYQITENRTEGWRVTTDRTVSGSTGEAVQTVVFNNASAAFVVTKTLKDGTEKTEEKFTFLLTDGSGRAMTGVTYWLYDIYGNPQYDEYGEVISLLTGTDGSFLLKADQAAVFYGMEAGTQYSVSEISMKGWKQTVPSAITGYTGKTISDAVEILPFENEAVNLSGTLTVTKLIEAVSALSAPAEDEFTFCLYNENGDAVSNALYSISIGGETYTYKTGESGNFSIHAGETAVFSSLPFGTYSVKEISVPERTHEAYKFSYLTVTDGEESTICEENGASGVLDEDGLMFEYTNTYSAPSSITVYKYQDDGFTPLSDVTFTLSDADGNMLAKEMTGADGLVYFENLNAGTYIITETSTQDGYSGLINSFTVTLPHTMTKDEVKSFGTDTTDAVWRADTELWYFFDVIYHITNSAVLDLPETGGNGWFVPVAAGEVLFAVSVAAATGYRVQKDRRTRRKAAEERKTQRKG